MVGITLKINEIKLILIEKELKETFTTSFGPTKKRKIVLVRVKTDDDVIGWGESVAGNGPWFSYETYETVWITLRDFLSKLILKRDIIEPLTTFELFNPIRGHNMAKYALEGAILDAYGKTVGKSLKELVGGVKNEVEVGVSVGIKKTIDELIESIEGYLNEGYKRVKIKIKPGWDVEPLKAIRETFGDIKLQVDANAAYTMEHLETLKKLDDFNLLMIEQPFHYEDLVDHAQLQGILETPICLDESITSIHSAKAAVKLRSGKIINIKPGRVGGVYVAKQIHDLGVKNNMGLWIGGMLETGIGRSFLVALASLPGINYPSDVSASSRYWDRDIVEPEFKLSNDGKIRVPEKPGIGVEVLEDEIDKIKIRELVLK